MGSSVSSGSGWVGGEHIKAQQWGTGATHSGEGAKKFGSASAKRKGRFRFNPNPTRCNHVGCQISLRARADKDFALNSPRPVIVYSNGKKRKELSE